MRASGPRPPKSALKDARKEKRVFRALVTARCRATGPLTFELFDSRSARYNFRALHTFQGRTGPAGPQTLTEQDGTVKCLFVQVYERATGAVGPETMQPQARPAVDVHGS